MIEHIRNESFNVLELRVHSFDDLGRQGGWLGSGQLRHLGKGDEAVRLEER